MTDLDHTIFQLRNAMKNAEPGPYELYTSNSFRRVGLADRYKEIVYATTQRDGHPDIAGEVHLHAMVMAFNAVPALLEEIERLRKLALTLYEKTDLENFNPEKQGEDWWCYEDPKQNHATLAIRESVRALKQQVLT